MNAPRFSWLLVVASLATACGDDAGNPAPTFTTGAGAAGGAGGAGGGEGGGGSGGTPPECLGEDDCYSCEPTNNTQFLNACTDSQCSPFDNVARLPLYNNGDLPPLP